MFQSPRGSFVARGFARRRLLTSLIAVSLGAALAATGFTVSPQVIGASSAQAAETKAPYLDTSLSPQVRAADLVSRMTLAEKNLQLRATSQDKNATGASAPAIPRLGVKVYNYWNEGMHGVARAGTTPPQNWGGIEANNPGVATEFPTALGMASTWDPDIIYQEGAIIGDEARAYYNLSGKGLTYWSPTINLSRDPRWGRAEESYGEDPLLTSKIGGQFVKGVQGDNPTYLKAVATPKHYLANNVDQSRSSQNSVLTERALREYYTPAFAALAGTEYGAKSLMSGYHAVNGVPSPADSFALETLLRRTWGFDGFTTSDCSALQGIYGAGHDWRPETLGGARITRVQGMAWAMKAGTDVDCEGGTYSNATQGVTAAINQGLMTEADIDISLTRAFAVRMELGEFDNPADVPWSGSAYTIANQISNPDHLAVAAQMSDEAPVLLKNEAVAPATAPVLPLTADDATGLVVVGEFAPTLIHGDYSPTTTTNQTTHLQGIEAAAAHVAGAGANVTYIPGESLTSGTMPILGSIQFLDATDQVLAEVTPSQFFANASGWANLRTVQGTTWPQEVLSNPNTMSGRVFLDDVTIPAGAVKIAVGTGGVPTATMAGGFFNVHVGTANGPRVTNPVLAEGAAAAELALNANGRIPTYRSQPIIYTLPNGDPLAGTTQDLYFVYGYNFQLSQQDEQAIAAAKAVVAVVGTRESDSQENNDRSSIDFPRGQADLVKAVAGLNSRTVVWCQSVSDMNIEPFNDQVPAMVWSSYNGEYQGDATGRLLFGQANPSGKLPITFYTDIAQLGPKTDYTLTPTDGRYGRTYQYFTGDVTYPFGHGLSYSSFEYSNLRLSRSSATPNETVTATVDVTNTSAIAGKEVVELYAISPLAGEAMYPDQQLKGFTKVAIEPGQTVTVSIPIRVADLWFWDDDGDRRTYATGEWTFRVGGSSVGALEATWNLTGTLNPTVDQVVAIPDGVSLNTDTPGNVIHANLSATRTDQSFYDLSTVRVVYTSSDSAVARVDAAGTVRPVGAGVAEITAEVTADGTTASTMFPVVVHAGALTSEYSDTTTTLFAQQVTLADRRVELNDAADGVLLNASVVPATSAAAYRFTIAPMDENTAQASITTAGVLTATAAGRVKVHVIATVGGTNYVRSAIVTVQTAPVTQSEGLAEQVIATEARGYRQDAYTVSSWQAYDAALAAAKAALNDPASTQSVIDQVAGALSAAEAALTLRADLTGLSASVALVQGLLPARSDYTQGTWVALNTAYIAAGALLADPSTASQAQADAGASALNAAIAGLVLDPDRFAVTSLAQLVAALTSAELVGADYTSASWAAYREALRAATSVMAQDPVNRLSAAAALTSLDNAFRWLVHRVPTAGLAAQVAAAAAVPTAGYTQASVEALATALAVAKAVVAADPDSVTQARVATAQARLAAALSGLEALIPQPGPTVVVQQPGQTTVATDPASARGSLGALVGQASLLDQASFTGESWAAFAAALGTARAVAGSAASSPAQVSSAVVSLTAALAGLVKVPVGPPAVEQPLQNPGAGAPSTVIQSVKAGTIKIKGTAKVGRRLTASVTEWTAATKYSYQWYSGSTKIKNATNKTLKLTKALTGKKIRVVVTGTKKGMVSATKTSKATKKVKA